MKFERNDFLFIGIFVIVLMLDMGFFFSKEVIVENYLYFDYRVYL